MPRIMGVTNARQNFAELVSELDEHSEPIYLTHFNEPRAVLIGYNAFEQFLERLEDLEDIVAIYQGREEPRRSFEEVWTEIEAESEVESERALSGLLSPVG